MPGKPSKKYGMGIVFFGRFGRFERKRVDCNTLVILSTDIFRVEVEDTKDFVVFFW